VTVKGAPKVPAKNNGQSDAGVEQLPLKTYVVGYSEEDSEDAKTGVIVIRATDIKLARKRAKEYFAQYDMSQAKILDILTAPVLSVPRVKNGS